MRCKRWTGLVFGPGRDVGDGMGDLYVGLERAGERVQLVERPGITLETCREVEATIERAQGSIERRLCRNFWWHGKFEYFGAQGQKRRFLGKFKWRSIG